MLEEWLNCQRSWLYLEPIFSSEDINRQLPVESKRYQTMERIWRKIMKNVNENREVRSHSGWEGQMGPLGASSFYLQPPSRRPENKLPAWVLD